MTRLVEDLRPYLIGWRGYFGFCQTPLECSRIWKHGSPKITHVSLAAMAERVQSLQGTAPSWRVNDPSGDRRQFIDGPWRMSAHR
ncbi:hypothetical protein ACFFWD_00445 [Bradyrhizobium erythrophlei]|uniref:hypothetical protein n=1 Tax=Bradyrhizobium erythrophlei TaxID=1437360 RepID=UPI0035EACD4A